MRAAVLVAGYGGTERQPLLAALTRALSEVGIGSCPITLSPPRSRPSPRYARELAALRDARDELRAMGAERVALVGRSFGGRMCLFLASEEPPDAVVVIGHPIAPPGRPRPRDEAALADVRCPTLVVQGDRDELGPLTVLRRVSAGNPLVDIVEIAGSGHELSGAHEREAVAAVVRWLDAVLR